MRTKDDRVTSLGEAECRRLLSQAVVGRVGFTAQALPSVQPVHFGLLGNSLVIPVLPGGRLATSCDGAVVAVQADSFGEGSFAAGRGGGWSVQAVGPARDVADDDEVAALDRLGLEPVSAAGNHCYLVVEMALITGWRFAAESAGSLAARRPPISA